MLYGRGAGALPTASAVVSDVIYAATHAENKYSTFKNNATADPNVKFISNFESEYYVRLAVDDEPGVLAKVSGIFGKYGISLVAVSQIEQTKEDDGEGNVRVPIVIITHKTNENRIKNAMSKINASGIGKVQTLLRVAQ